MVAGTLIDASEWMECKLVGLYLTGTMPNVVPFTYDIPQTFPDSLLPLVPNKCVLYLITGFTVPSITSHPQLDHAPVTITSEIECTLV